jgi:hypothetical protein
MSWLKVQSMQSIWIPNQARYKKLLLGLIEEIKYNTKEKENDKFKSYFRLSVASMRRTIKFKGTIKINKL